MPGLNAPIPPGTSFGYQPGGWGKPPVNEDGEPLYGDVFGQFADEEDDEQVHPMVVWLHVVANCNGRAHVMSSLCNRDVVEVMCCVNSTV